MVRKDILGFEPRMSLRTMYPFQSPRGIESKIRVTSRYGLCESAFCTGFEPATTRLAECSTAELTEKSMYPRQSPHERIKFHTTSQNALGAGDGVFTPPPPASNPPSRWA